MVKELISSSGGNYYAKDRSVFKKPVKHTYSDGSIGYDFGFKVCECEQFVDGAAEHIVVLLNEHEKLTPHKEPT